MSDNIITIINFGMLKSEFLAGVQGIKPYLQRNAVNPQIFSWRLVNDMIARHDSASANFKLMKNGIIPKQQYMESYLEVGTIKHRVHKPSMYDLLRNGASLVLNKIENTYEVEDIRNQIAQYCGRQTVISGYAAFGDDMSFGNHYDTHDVFAIQLIGSKRWTIYPPTLVNPNHTQSSVGRESECTAIPYMSVVLEAGDLFYLPRGWWHEVCPTGSETFHLAIGTYPAHASDYLRWVSERVINTYSSARASLTNCQVDKGGIRRLSEFMACELLNSQNYQLFNDEFSANERLHSNYAVEIFGNPSARIMPCYYRYRINANRAEFSESTYAIICGKKVLFDSPNAMVLQTISDSPGISSTGIASQLPHLEESEILEMLFVMADQDLIQIF